MNDKYRPADFKELLFNVQQVPFNVDLFDTFPELKKYPEFLEDLGQEEKHKNKIIRFIIYNYDRNSPFIKGESDYNKRKIESALLAGIKHTPLGDLPQWFRDIMAGRNLLVNNMIIRYCREQHSEKWSLLVAGSEAYYNILPDLISRDSDEKDAAAQAKKKGELFLKAETMQQSLEKMKKLILAGDSTREVEKALYRVIEDENKNLELTPEHMAHTKWG